MSFPQNNPLVDYRGNLILAAALELDSLKRLSMASPWLDAALAPLKGQNIFLGLLNEFAYNAIKEVVPGVIAKSVQQELMDAPIDLPEFKAVLAREIGAKLQVLQREQAQ
jgi:hypothetical protein